MKRTLLLICTLLCANVLWAQNFTIDSLSYTVTSASPAEVSVGSGSYNITTANIPAIVIYNGVTYTVTSIVNDGFEDCSYLTSVTIPNSVTTIGKYAFEECIRLTSVTFAENSNLTTIGNYAFRNCSRLTSVTIPNSVTSIGSSAFHNCDDLTSITIPEAVINIGERAFSDCDNLTSVNIPNSVTSIGNYAFSSCDSLISVTISNGVDSIYSQAFYNCPLLSSVTLPENAYISNDAFKNSGLTPYIDGLYYHLAPFVVEDDTISNAGFINFNLGNNPLPLNEASVYDYNDNFTTINIPSEIEVNENNYTITNIGEDAFYNSTNLTSITIPNTVTAIGEDAFYSCDNLTSITIPNSVTSIGDYAFRNCSSLTTLNFNAINCNSFSSDHPFYNCPITTINIGDSVQRIPAYFAYNKNNLTYITIPNSVTTIGNYAFSYCDNLTSITIPNSVTTIGNYAFSYCDGLTSITIPEAVINIGARAFYYCDNLTTLNFNSINCADFVSNSNQHPFKSSPISTINIGNSVERIPAYFAYSNDSLTSITFSDNVSYIGDSAFYDCDNITSLSISKGVTYIGELAFSGCDDLTTLNFNAINCADFESFNSSSFKNSPISSITFGDSVQNIPAYLARNKDNLTSIAFPNSVVSIGKEAFYDCDGLTSVTIGNNVISIGEDAFSYSDYLSTINFNAINCEDFSSVVFYGCPVTTINFGIGVQRIPAYFAYGFNNLNFVSIANTVTSIGDFAFRSCSGLNMINIPNSVTYIGKEAFCFCTGLTNAFVGSGVATIGDYAFYGCSNLQNFNFIFNNSLTTIGQGAFRYCSNLNAFNIPSSTISIGSAAFSDCSNLTSITIPESVTSIGRNAFGFCTNLASATLPSNLSVIDTSLFLNCTSLTSIDIPENITNIYSYAFQNCNSLSSITIPENVTSIGSSAFSYCTSLDSISFGENSNITSIGRNAFDSCINLTSIDIPNNLSFIDTSTFRYCINLASVSVPEHITAIGPWAFMFCSNLDSINIPNTVTSIGYLSFWNCSSLTSIDIPNSVTFIEEYAFENCSDLTEVTIGTGINSIGNYAFWNCNNLSTINFNAINCGDFPYDNSHPFFSAPISTFNIGEGVQRIPTYLIQNKSLITSINIPNSVDTIGTFAFYNCSGLNSITIGQGVTFIGNTAFFNCNNLQSVTSLASIPPTIDYTSFPYPNNAILRVPCHSYSNYDNSMTWGMVFDSIESIYYSVNVLANNATWGTVAVEVSCDTSIITATPSNTCYQFGGWNDGNTDNPRIVSLSSDTNLVANFELMTLSNELTATICEGQVYTENGFNVSEAGVYTQTLQTVNGCDSIVTLTLNVNPIYNTELSANICQGQVYTENGFNVSEAGVYTQTLTSVNGCDSIVTLTLNVNPIYNTELTATICQGQTYTENNFNVSEAGVYTQTLTSVNGCDSIVTLTLNVNPIYNTELTATICQGQTYTENNFNVSEAGVYTQTLTAVNGCDSIVTLTLNVNPIFNTELTATICEGQVYTENNFNVSEAGVYTQTLTSVNGCDSIVTLTLNVNPIYNTELSATICEGQVYTENNFNVSEAGVYTQTLTSVNGCDSIVTLTVNVNPIYNTELSATICEGQVYTENNFNVSEAGVYTQTLTSVNGCDSIVTLTLNVNPIYNTELTATICEGQVYAENGFNISEAGVYTQTLTSANGCDSIVTLTLNVNPIYNTELTATICEGQVYTENNFNISEAGVYTQTLTSVNGCDSIVTLTVSVNPTFDTTINATINPGETYAEFGFNESEAGTYVQNLQTEFGCDSTITLVLSVNSSLLEAEIEEISFYPNPTKSEITFSQAIEKVEVIDLTGKAILTFSNAKTINIESLPAGAYYLRLTNNDKAVLRKLIKE